MRPFAAVLVCALALVAPVAAETGRVEISVTADGTLAIGGSADVPPYSGTDGGWRRSPSHRLAT